MPRSLSLTLPISTLITVGALLTVTLGEAEAHPNHGPSLGERYLKLEARDDRLRLVYGLTYSSRHGRRFRTGADTDEDGRVSADEERRLGQTVRQQVRDAFELVIDGRRRELDWSEPFVNAFAGPIRAGPATIEMTDEVPLGPGLHVIEVSDRAEFTGIYRTNTSVVVRGEVELIRSGKGRDPSGRDRRFVSMDLPSPGTPPARIALVEVRLPGAAPIGVVQWPGMLLGIGLVLILGLVILTSSRR